MTTQTQERTAARGAGTPQGSGAGLPGAVAAEWEKLWTLRAVWVWLAAGTAIMTVYTYYFGAIANFNEVPPQPVSNAPISAMILVQFVFAGMAMGMVTGEYATTSIRTSLLCVPRRGRLLLAKSLVAAAVAFVVTVLYSLWGLVVAWYSFDGLSTFAPGTDLVRTVYTGIYAALVAVFAVGVSTAIRFAAGTLALLFNLLFMAPLILRGMNKPLLTTINNYLPQDGGNTFMTGAGEPYPGVVGLLIVVAWAIAGYVAGLIVLQRRDA